MSPFQDACQMLGGERLQGQQAGQERPPHSAEAAEVKGQQELTAAVLNLQHGDHEETFQKPMFSPDYQQQPVQGCRV